MVATSITALIVIIVFFIYLGWMFVLSILELFINGIIIYALFLRSHVEIVKEGKHYFYLAGAAAAIIVYLLAGNFLSGLLVWGITTWLVLAFIFSQIGIHGHYLHKKYKKSK